ncbi:hypothetical protein [Streptomyces sp. NPDC093260]|uniref:hypothetical protein n=1 Tax=Streptomyces sp. NPDC093260 TaxID=3155073 RepID=UPI0034193F56
MGGLTHRFSDEGFAMPAALITGGNDPDRPGGGLTAGRRRLPGRGHRTESLSLARAGSGLPDDVLVVRSGAGLLPGTDALMSAASERFGCWDPPFLDAGICRPAPVAEVTEESFDKHADLGFKGQYFTLRRSFPS